jgi:organic hydroperoxide reductase OsmC/OhrA
LASPTAACTIGAKAAVPGRTAMTTQEIAAALKRVEAVLRDRPGAGQHDDGPAIARWEGALRVATNGAGGVRIVTDMPREFGGSGDDFANPGWLFHAALASCATTRIAMAAAAEGIELAALEVVAGSSSDARGIFGMADAGGEPVPAGPRDVRLHVRIGAPGASPERLRALVADSCRSSPVADAAQRALPVDLRIDVDAH